jgi:hypothetical protein
MDQVVAQALTVAARLIGKDRREMLEQGMEESA